MVRWANWAGSVESHRQVAVNTWYLICVSRDFEFRILCFALCPNFHSAPVWLMAERTDRFRMARPFSSFFTSLLSASWAHTVSQFVNVTFVLSKSSLNHGPSSKMTAPAPSLNLPDELLHEIFGYVVADATPFHRRFDDAQITKLRSVCRTFRSIPSTRNGRKKIFIVYMGEITTLFTLLLPVVVTFVHPTRLSLQSFPRVSPYRPVHSPLPPKHVN